MKHIGIACGDNFLYQKIKLAVRDLAECERIENGGIAERMFDICLVDADEFSDVEPTSCDRIIRMSRTRECDLAIPFLNSDLMRVITDGDRGGALYASEEKRCVYLGGRCTKLTELEFSLITLLLSERRFFSSEEILRRVWRGTAESGIVNVYIHYLREKLESDGDRIIISARGKGYRIDERFMPGGDR